MKPAEVIEALAALAHAHRLGIFKMLVEQGPTGLAAGNIASKVGLVPSSLTFHLQALQRARLIIRRRESRQLIYSADYTAMNGLIGYLTDNCCINAAECPPSCNPSRPARVVKRVVTGK